MIKTTDFVMCEWMKSLTVSIRSASYEEKALMSVLKEVFDILNGIIEVEE